MIIVDKFNALDGKTLSRDEINELISEAIGQDQTIIAQRLQNVLNRYDSERIEFIIDNPAIEETPVKGLSGIYDFDTPEEEFNGLAKSVSPNDVYNMITARMIEMVEKASGKEYQKKWGNKAEPMQGYLIPFNFVTQKRYRGVNLFLLTEFQPISNPFFMTFKQIEERKARVKKGAKGFPVVYFTQLYTYQQTEPDLQFGTYDKDAFKKWVISNKSDIHPLKGNKPLSIDDLIFQSTIPILKYYNVFNGADIEGIDFDLDNFKTGYINIEAPATEENRIAAAEAIIEHFPEPTPNYVEKGNVASYSPGADLVKMPPFKTFDTAQDFYRTLFHEYSHSTGHPDRLNREFGRKFGDKKYAFEELVAEWGAVFLSAEAGIIFHDQKNHAEYLKNWSRSLAFAEKDNKFIMKAATQAQKVADYVLQFDTDGNPKYLKHLKPDETPIEIVKPKSVPKKRKTDIKKPIFDIKKPKIVTDPADVQKIKNAIKEGEMILTAGKSNGKKLNPDQLEAIQKQVNKDRAKIGLPPFETPVKNDNQGKTDKNKYPFSADEIPFETARRAHQWTSFTPDRRGEQEQQRYFNTLKEVYDKYYQVAIDKNLKDKFLNLFQKYHDGLKIRKLNELRSRSNVASTMITGGSGFNVRRNEKANNAHRSKEKILYDFHDKYMKYFDDLLFPETKPIKTGKAGTLEKLEEKLETLEKNQALMVEANAELRKIKKKYSDVMQIIDAFEVVLKNMGFSDQAVKDVLNLPKREKSLVYLGFNTTNSGAEIRRIKQRIEVEKKLKKASEVKGTEDKYYFEGGYIFNDYAENKVKIHFDEKPSEEIRTFLKKPGQNYKWSPFLKVWMRQLNTYYRGNKDDLFAFLNVTEPVKKTKTPPRGTPQGLPQRKTKEELDQINPKGFSEKPKSVAVGTAIKDVLSLDKYKGEKELPASLIYKHFKDNETDFADINSDYEKAILEKSNSKLFHFFGDEIEISDYGRDFVNSVNGRLQSLRNQKSNYALFPNLKGAKKGLKAADQNPNSLAYRLQNRNRSFESYKIDNADIAEFLGTIEIKEKESVAITLTGTQGSMKTRFIFQVMNALGQNYKIGHASIEEHPESSLYFDKVDEYLNETAIANITSPEINTIEDVHKLVRENDVIVIDSFSKLQELDPKIQLDKDFRKKYHGKLFIIIYQTTSDGKMRGGSKSQFDGDIILFIEKFPDYTQNYVYPDKNRYNKRNCSELKYNIFLQKLMIPETENETVQSEPETQNTEPIELNFNVN